MSRRGGYQLIDLKGIDLSSAGTIKIDGIYAAIEGNYNKRVVVSGLVIGATEFDDITADVVLNGTEYTLRAGLYNIFIDEDDVVTYHSAIMANLPDSEEASYPTVAEFNALLQELKDAGLMIPDEE